MKLYHHLSGVFLEAGGQWYTVPGSWDSIVNRPGLGTYLISVIPSLPAAPGLDLAGPLRPPLGSQEVWAAGVTYYRSREARMEESKDAGGGSFYDRVYLADRPELFFKSMPTRVAGHRGEIRIRRDSAWNVPEPELTLFISSSGTIEGFTIGNDVSSRSIEGENPLYLPQAKTYQYSAALGPALFVPEPVTSGGSEAGSGTDAMPNTTSISLSIERSGTIVFSGSTTLAQLKRSFDELAQWLFRETEFPQGVYLMTGTGIVPPDDFTLLTGDAVSISIDGIGSLVNTVGVRR